MYLSLAILLGGGLVLFGIGGDVQGGLFDALSNNDGDADEQFQERRDDAAKRTETNPNNPLFWAQLAEAEYQVASNSKGYAQGKISDDARKHLVAAKAAWERHLKLAGDEPNRDAASTMRNAFLALEDTAGAVRAQEAYIDALGESQVASGDFFSLAQLAWAAGQDRKGDLAADRAVELAPKDERKDLRQQLDAAKVQTAAQGATTSTTATTPSG